MKRIIGVVTGIVVLAAGLSTGEQVEARTAAGAESVVRPIRWGTCPGETRTGAPVRMECGTLRVPLDPARPLGQQITIAVSRVRGSVSRDANHLGVLLVNPGGPGMSGLALARHVADELPPRLAARFDIIGFDPRGVGASRPAISCVRPERYYAAPRLDHVPRTAADERALLERARYYATECGNRWSWFLPYLTTENTARDIDAIRAALGEERISFLGYSYGSYLGAVYATLYPHRVKRLVLDSVVDAGGVWYRNNLAQNIAFDRRHRDFLAWVARHRNVYRLGRSAERVGFAWYAMRDRLRERPAGGVVGPSELDDLFTLGGYTSALWPELARAFSDYVHAGDTAGLLEAYRKYARNGAAEENGYAVYLGIQCRDARWPAQWSTWRADARRQYRRAPFMAWANTWYNAPCRYWPVQAGTPVRVGSDLLPPILMLQSRRDAATPYQGALRTRRLLPSARLVLVRGGEHGVSLLGNACVDRHLVAYLEDGTVPGGRQRRGTGPDAVCPGVPAPTPGATTSATAGAALSS